jgi:hypothetical protein
MGDSVIGINGVVMLMNQLTGESLDITGGITGFLITKWCGSIIHH